MMTETAAEQVLVSLRTKREAMVARGRELADERAACSYAARIQYDVEARGRLVEVNAELALHDSALRSLDAAIAEAEKRVRLALAD